MIDKDRLKEIQQEIRDRMKRIRQSKNLTRSNMDAELDRAPGYYAKLERGLIALSIERLIELAEVWEISPGQLFEDKKPVEEIFQEDGPGYTRAIASSIQDVIEGNQLILAEVRGLSRDLANKKNDPHH